MSQDMLPWWKTATIYQIYPKSFQATNGRATGDLRGIIQRLDYLKKLGVGAIWLTPIYPSPQIDNGYDVSDYCAINPEYGSMADFEELVNKAHQLDIKIMMDMVLNHTSTAHPWFTSALDKTSPYRAFYIWKDANHEGEEPNNWRSKFGGKAWQWDEASNQYYLHLFAAQQADLNWENPVVRKELKQVCQFWADKGVDALRLDVINLVSKQQDFANDNQGDGRRFYTDGPRVHEFLQEMSRDVFMPNNLVTVGEMSSTSLEHCQQYATLDGKELTMTFNFHHLKVDYPDGEKWSLAKPDFIQLKQIMAHWQQGMHNKAWNALFWCNHDQPRIVSRFGDTVKFHNQSAKMLAMVLYGLQGTPYIYQGEEIGMTNPNFTDIDQYRDIESLNMFDEMRQKGLDILHIMAILASKSRDNGRTPMQWDNTANAGFTSGIPWISVANNYPLVNASAALADNNSIFYCYQKLIALRKQYSIFSLGDYHDLDPNSDKIWIYQRQYNDKLLLVIANLHAEPLTCSLSASLIDKKWQILLNNYSEPCQLSSSFELAPYQAIYLYHDGIEK
ncbi:alpha,alpha-phosphotrehalase [Orbus sturtevantii]|uniref:alpha,alpha-phosphotrehalase n=1 Tax=Orbus sturtevantii TaxID=3074109 RepID=UPI00370D154A